MSILALKNQPDERFVLYLVNNLAQFRLAIKSCVQSKYDFLIYFNNSSLKYLIKAGEKLPPNVRVTYDYRTVAMLAGSFNLILTMVGHFSPVLGNDFLSIIKFSQELGIPILEVPHGLFQLGYNFSDNSKVINGASNFDGLGFSVPSFSSKKITWFGSAGIGYPCINLRQPNAEIPRYTVITTNTNWYMYDESAQIRLASLIIANAESNPSDLYVWCPHPAEESAKTLFYLGMLAAPSNVLLYGMNKDVFFSGFETTEDLIANAEKGITTVSTCILDYEINEVPASIFTASVFDSLLSDFVSFSTCDSLNSLGSIQYTVPNTGLLKDFDVAKFDAEIAELIGSSCVNNVSKISKFL